MTREVPAFINGIDPKSQEIAQDLARRSGMTLIEWLDEMIFNNDTRADPRRSTDGLDWVLATIDELSTRLDNTEASHAQFASRFESALSDLRANQVQAMCQLRGGEASGISGEGSRPEALRVLDNAVIQIASHVNDGERRNCEAMDLLSRDLSTELQRVSEHLTQKAQENEKRRADAIFKVGGEVAGVAAAIEKGLHRADERQASAIEKLGVEIARITERLSERIAATERRSSDAIDDVGEQMTRIADRIYQRQERSTSELADRMRQSEERTAKLLQEAREKLHRRLARRDGDEVPLEAGAFYARWSAGDLVVKQSSEYKVAGTLQSEATKVEEPVPAFCEPSPTGLDALLANIDVVLNEEVVPACTYVSTTPPGPTQTNSVSLDTHLHVAKPVDVEDQRRDKAQLAA